MGIVEELLQAYEPTEEDIAKELSQEQLIKLCQHNRCRVEMWKWNVVEDFAQHFRDAGRLEGKSKKFIHKLLVKAYKRNKQLFQQIEEQKHVDRIEEWAYRKKNSLLQLDMWDYEENMQIQDKIAMTESEEEQEVLRQQYVNNNSTAANNHSPAVEIGMTDSEEQEVLRQQYVNNNLTTAIDPSPAHETQASVKITIFERNERMSIDVGTEKDAYAVPIVPIYPSSQEQLTHSPKKSQQQSEKQNVSEPSIIKEIMEINSESMTIDTQTLTDCIDDMPDQVSSEEVVAFNLSDLQETPLQPIIGTQSEFYDDFHERMPLTSTQDALLS